jgi:hypothetical protein
MGRRAVCVTANGWPLMRLDRRWRLLVDWWRDLMDFG